MARFSAFVDRLRPAVARPLSKTLADAVVERFKLREQLAMERDHRFGLNFLLTEESFAAHRVRGREWNVSSKSGTTVNLGNSGNMWSRSAASCSRSLKRSTTASATVFESGRFTDYS